MQEIAFKVSAKAARLIGRESVSNAEGAIGELVKNTYDADANACSICFTKRYQSLPEKITRADYNWLSEKDTIFEELFEFEKPSQVYVLKNENLTEGDLRRTEAALSNFLDLWIIDNGTGMSDLTIQDNWMVIGTEFKEQNVVSKGGRTRTGAKGIGRFAIDRLGSTCDLYSFTKKDGAINWVVNWGNFDGLGKTLDQVTAQLYDFDSTISNLLEDKLPNPIRQEIYNKHFSKRETGTLIRISHLRDDWSEIRLQKLDRAVSALVPPLEQQPLDIFLYHYYLKPDHQKITPALLDDYDYKVNASFDGNQINFNIHRNELIAHEMNLKVFEREDMKEDHFSLNDFENGHVKYSKSLDELYGKLSEEEKEAYKNVGPFNFTLLFFKRSLPGGADRKMYPYRDFRGAARKSWLEQYAGIKIYRDHFAVRPYGDVGSRAFDWLALGQRVAGNPAQASRKGWRVGPQNLAGTVSISRLTNPGLYDQVTREGLIENAHFDQFRSLLLRTIQEFEDDRSHIHHNLSETYKEENKPARTISEGTAKATQLLENPEEATKEDAQSLAQALIAQSEEMDELREEQAMMRSLATLGTVLVSFSHEMGQLQSSMGSRSQELRGILSSYVDEDYEPSNIFHPYSILDDWAEDDKKVKQWFTFALTSVRANKRRRNWVDLRSYLESSLENWSGFLRPRKIDLELDFHEDYRPEILAFPIDLESIFNNLLINSVEVLISNRHSGERKIKIELYPENDTTARVVYSDNGPGIDPSIKPPSKIFDYNVTTKRDEKNNLVGTGLGMWILNTIVREYGGSVKVYKPSEQYGMKMELFLPARKNGD